MSPPLRFVALAAVLVALGVSLTTRPVQAHSRTPPCESFGLRGIHSMNAQNSVQWTPGGSELLFIHNDQLYQASADGMRVQGTFAVPYEAHIESRSYIKVYLSHADVSPDGTRVAYSVCWDSFTFWDSPPREPPDEESRAVDAPIGTVFFEVAVWDATTDEVDYLAVGSVPVWSPDGARIAFLSDHNYADPPADRRARVEADPGLFSMAADGSDIQRLAPADHGDVGLPPRWSPDGQLLAFVRGVGSAEQAVYTVGADGSDPRQIAAAASLPSWSPDGERLALALPDGEEVALYTIAADGSDPRRLTTIEGWQSQGWNEGSSESDPATAWIETVAWSPDGSKILYTCGWASVCVVDTDGNPIGMSPENLGEPHGPAWSPDGSQIAIGIGAEVDRYSRSVPEILYTMKPDGSDLQVLVVLGVGLVAAASSLWWCALVIDVAHAVSQFIAATLNVTPGDLLRAPLFTLLAAVETGEVGVAIFIALLYLVFGFFLLYLLVQMILRLALIDILLTVAPIALGLWILPHTAGWGRHWLRLFMTTVFQQAVQLIAVALGFAFLGEFAAIGEFEPVQDLVWKLLMAIAFMYLAGRVPSMLGNHGTFDAWLHTLYFGMSLPGGMMRSARSLGLIAGGAAGGPAGAAAAAATGAATNTATNAVNTAAQNSTPAGQGGPTPRSQGP